MLALLDNGQDLGACEAELGGPVGQLLTPLTRYLLRDPDRPWAIDNGAYAGFEAHGFLSLLEREQHRSDHCLFVAVPDVVGSARRTLECFEYWEPKIGEWPLAFVCQDGQEDLPIPWDSIEAVFIGGTTSWKCSPHAAQIIRAAQVMDRWVHIGRVNHGERLMYFEQLGADSYDGTGVARYTHMREAIANRHDQGKLCL